MMVFVYIVAAVVLLGLCIFVHELGHLLGGRLVGIKAKVFSLGFGKGFIKKKFGDTTWQITLIPFGGYCQFYGEMPATGGMPDDEAPETSLNFYAAAPWRRMFTVFMGPFFNLLFGILLFFIMNLAGYTKDTNRIQIPAELMSGKNISAAYAAGLRDGDRIIDINGSTVRGFDDLQMAVIFSDGEPLTVTYERDGETKQVKITPALGQGGRYVIGVLPYGKRLMAAGLEYGGAAERAGIRDYDEILSVDGKSVEDYGDFTGYIKTKAGEPVKIRILRNGEEQDITLTPVNETFATIDGKPILNRAALDKAVEKMAVKINGSKVFSSDNFWEYVKMHGGEQTTMEIDGSSVSGVLGMEERGYIGVYLAFAPESVDVTFTVPQALKQAVIEPFSFIVYNLKGFGMIFSGEMSVRENLSGPVRIAQIAGDVAYYKGISAFVLLMAKISIILMVMNLLPIPAVDGSHIIFYAVEMIRGKPLSPEVMMRIQTAGVLLLIVLGIFVLVNDISMLPAIQRLFN